MVAAPALYGGTYKLLRDMLSRFGVRARMAEPEALVEACARGGARLCLFESPTNPTLRVVDIRAVARTARGAGAISLIDSTFAPPVVQRPLASGVDLVMHSASKFLNGHSDHLCGAIAGRRELVEKVRDACLRRLDAKPRQNPPVDGVYCALGWIRYPEAPEQAGTLIYVKPGFHGSEPPDIRAYAALHEQFPHESTADQWFSESQMESYRGLGSHIIGKLCGSLETARTAPGGRRAKVDLRIRRARRSGQVGGEVRRSGQRQRRLLSQRADPAPAMGLFDAPTLNGRPDCSELIALNRQLPSTAPAVDPFFIAGRSQTKICPSWFAAASRRPEPRNATAVGQEPSNVS